MDKTAIKNFAIWARNQLIESCKQKAYEYGVAEDGDNRINIDAIGSHVLSNEEKEQRKQLIEQINQKGYDQVMEEVAYTWFNRFIALRFMEVNGYLPSRVRVFTDENNEFKPEIIKEAMSVDIDGIDRAIIVDFIEKQDNEGLYKYLIIAQCNALNSGLPYMFEKISNWTELLYPDNLLRNDSVLGQMIASIPEEDWTDQVQIIGWLYQYYISEKHESVIDPLHSKAINKEELPAATQVFTTDWVVRYLIDNSVGRYWIERNPKSHLNESLTYYIKPRNSAKKKGDEKVTPQEVTVFDPCVGSGHFLVYAFEVLMRIYVEHGYSEREAATEIVKNNLFGLDVDGRAVQLAYFAVMMKARQYDRRLFSRGIQPNIYEIIESNTIDRNMIEYFCGTDSELKKEVISLLKLYFDAKEYGSILHVPDISFETINKKIIQSNNEISMYNTVLFEELQSLIHLAEVMSKRYAVVATNPPYLNKYSLKLRSFIVNEYPDYKGDLFSVFIYRNFGFCKHGGYSALMTPNVWMFILSYEKLRKFIIDNKTVCSLIQMAKGAFFKEATVDVCAFVLSNKANCDLGKYFRLESYKGDMDVQEKGFLYALKSQSESQVFELDQSLFLQIRGYPIAYWISDNMRKCFNEKPLSAFADTRRGLQTGNSSLFIRKWYEVYVTKVNLELTTVRTKYKWVLLNSGGAYRKWYGNIMDVVNWENNGRDIKATGKAIIPSEERYFDELISWNKVTSGDFSVRYQPRGIIPGDASPFLHTMSNSKCLLFYALAILNSKVSAELVKVLSPTLNFEVGKIAEIPIIETDNEGSVISIVKECIEVSKEDWDSFETSWDFKKHPLI